MKATEAKLLDFLKKSPQFVIPIYQRTYSWTQQECEKLWDDIMRAGSDESVTAHFVGSIVYIEEGLYHVSSQSPLLVIDGQQRVTSLTLLLEALARALGDHEPVDGFSAKKIRSYYLLNPLEDGDRFFKLLLTQTDRETLLALVQQKELPAAHSLLIKNNFDFFQQKIKLLGNDLTRLCNGLSKLIIVDIALSRQQDNPQLIFESMNSTGRELTQADLIRNFILMGQESSAQTALYNDYWRPMELEFGQEAYGTHFDSFMRHYLTLQMGEIPNVNAVYEAFKTHARSPRVASRGTQALVKEIRTFARYYCRMALGKEPDGKLDAAFQDLRELKVDVAFPFLLELYADYAAGVLTRDDFVEAVRLIEAYVFRRAVCAIPTNSLNKTFATFTKTLKKDAYLESIRAHFLLLPSSSYRRFPGDEEFERELQVRDLYNFRSRTYWLRRLENHERKELVPVGEYTIEHIMPQNPVLSAAWKSALGSEWERVHKTWLHTLGNLTLTGYNSEYSDRPFPEKRDMEGGFHHSPLQLNKGLGQVEQWDEAAIIARAQKLAALAVGVWRAPQLSDEIMADYQPPREQAPTLYAIEDHPYLLGDAMRPVFEALRREILALDLCVTEEFLKLYVAYKAETNFVDIVPQASRLRLSLNMKFHEIHDSKGWCEDFTGRGGWGNGDVRFWIESLDQIPYGMGLIRQALEKQMGNTDVIE